MSTRKPSLSRVLYETSHVISANPRHFLALSVLFILPIAFSTTISFLLHPTQIHSHYRRILSSISTPDPEVPVAEKSQLLIQVLAVLIVLFLNLSALSSITHSTFHGFYGKPMKFVDSLKSILVSFLPLLVTKLASVIILAFVSACISLQMVFLFVVPALLGFNIDNNSVSFMVVVGLMAALLLGLLVYMGVEFYLRDAIVVLESQWGFAPLKRSSDLVKGMRGTVFSVMLVFAILSLLLSAWYSSLVANYAGNVSKGRTGWVLVQMVAYAGFSTMLSLYSLVAETVVFVYCKALHDGESGLPIDEKLGGVLAYEKLGVEYVKLPVDAV